MNSILTWLVRQLFGSNWKQTLVNSFSIGAETYFASQGQVTKEQVQAWMMSHITTIASEIAKGAPAEAALLVGAAEAVVPQVVDEVYSYVVEHALGTAAGKAIEQAAAANQPPSPVVAPVVQPPSAQEQPEGNGEAA